MSYFIGKIGIHVGVSSNVTFANPSAAGITTTVYWIDGAGNFMVTENGNNIVF